MIQMWFISNAYFPIGTFIFMDLLYVMELMITQLDWGHDKLRILYII